jgi:hypothetical protein
MLDTIVVFAVAIYAGTNVLPWLVEQTAQVVVNLIKAATKLAK